MVFIDDPRREQIEPMHEFLEVWARSSRLSTRRYVSPTLVVMERLEDASTRKAVRDMREEIAAGLHPIALKQDHRFCEAIADKVEVYLRKMMLAGYARDVFILKTYYIDTLNHANFFEISRKLGCRRWQIEIMVKDSLYRLSTFWCD